jgi:hypothetical protein
MPIYSKAARRWVEPLLALGAGGRVTLRFLAANADAASELGIVPEALLSDAFAQSVAAAQGLPTPREMFEAAAGVVLDGRVSRIRAIKPLAAGDEIYAWQLLCDAPLEAA